jgi:hypothetical protein
VTRREQKKLSLQAVDRAGARSTMVMFPLVLQAGGNQRLRVVAEAKFE